jgi:DNA-binding PadR family transcriptional regulator
LEAEFSRKMHRRIVESFLDMIVLAKLKNSSPLSGYDIVEFIHNKFGLLMSPGTIYSRLYSLERNGLVEGKCNQRKRVYSLTCKGEENIRLFLQQLNRIPRFVLDFFEEKQDA